MLRRDCREDALPIGRGRFDGRDRLFEIGHHNRARELARRIVGHRLKHGAVAQMHMPIVGPPDDETLHAALFCFYVRHEPPFRPEAKPRTRGALTIGERALHPRL